MFRYSRGAAASYVAALLVLCVSVGCTFQRFRIVPAAQSPGQHRRAIISVVKAGTDTYVVDEMYAPAGENLEGIAPGPSGTMWYAGGEVVGRATISSDFVSFPLPAYSGAYPYTTEITQGPDRNLWITGYPSAIARLSASGNVKIFPVNPKYGSLLFVTSGPGGALWFSAAHRAESYIVRMDVRGKARAFRLPANSLPQFLTPGIGGYLWFTDSRRNKIGRMSATGTLREYSVPTASSNVWGIAEGPDGRMWFVENSGNKVAALSATGSIKEYSIPTEDSGPADIAKGPDGALWFTEENAGKIGRITTSGAIDELKLSAPNAAPFAIAVGSDNNIWFTESQPTAIVGRVDLREVKGSDPVFSSISLSLGKSHAELGIPATFRLAVSAEDLHQHLIKGAYPTAIHLTTTDRREAALTQDHVTSAATSVGVRFSGHYTDATLGANANGGGYVQTATLWPSTQPELKLPSSGYGIGAAPDATVWICLQSGSIAHVASDESVTTYPAGGSFEGGCSILAGPDGNMWFTDFNNNQIDKITPDGTVTKFPLGDDAAPMSMTLGSDGAFWFVEGFANRIGRLTTGGKVKTFPTKNRPYNIVSGPDGNLWYTQRGGAIVKMATSGQKISVMTANAGSFLWSINGKIWFTKKGELEEMTSDGAIVATFTIPHSCAPFSLTAGPENSLWFASPGNCIGRITSSGSFYSVATYSQLDNPWLTTSIVVGPKGYLWFTETGTNGVGWIDPSTM